MPPLLKIIVVLILIAIVASLGSALFHLSKSQGDSKQMLKSLTWRISLSVALFILLLIAYAMGWISPNGVPRNPLP